MPDGHTNEVRALRLAAGLTQTELAARSGVAQPNLAAYETGQRTPSEAMLKRLRAAAKPRPAVLLDKHRHTILSLARRHKASQVRVFGSAARGHDTSGSDIDLLVRFAADADVFDLADLTTALEDLTGLHVDVVSDRGLRDADPILAEARPL
jgi:predicted nucleotidyltransferase/DNA-binding XRE family transcriptional regulator